MTSKECTYLLHTWFERFNVMLECVSLQLLIDRVNYLVEKIYGPELSTTLNIDVE